MSTQPFTPLGNTVAFTAATTYPAPVQATSFNGTATNYRIHNTGNVVVYIGFGNDTATANAGANTSISGQTISMVPGSVEVFSFNANQYFTGVTVSGTSVVTIMPGTGA